MRNSSSLDWLRFMHTPNDYRVSPKGGYGCCTYQRGLSALFVPDNWHCEGLEHGTDEGERFPRLFYIFLSTID